MTHIWPLPAIVFQAFDEIEEARPVILVTTPAAWEAAGSDLRSLRVARRLDIRAPVLNDWMELAAGLLAEAPKLDRPVIYAVGGGLAADAAKYLSLHTGLPLNCLPTILSVDSFFTSTSGVQHDGCITHIDCKPPDRLVIDFDFLAAAPEGLRAAGICDLLSIATALWDWEYAEEMGRSPEGMELVPWAADAAQAILQGAFDCAEAAGAGDPAGLKQLLDCLAMEVQLCSLLGHARPKEGSEHYFAFAVANFLEKPAAHSQRVGRGILQMAERQDQDLDELEQALSDCHIRTDRLSDAAVRNALRSLPDYVLRHDLPYSIAHEAVS